MALGVRVCNPRPGGDPFATPKIVTGACSVSCERGAGIRAARGSGSSTPAAPLLRGLYPVRVTTEISSSPLPKLAVLASSQPLGTRFWSAPGKARALTFPLRCCPVSRASLAAAAPCTFAAPCSGLCARRARPGTGGAP